MKVREATEADLPALRELVGAYQDEFWTLPFPAPPLPDDWFDEGRVLVAERDGEIVGTAKGVLRLGAGHISLVFLRSDDRGQGVGKELVRELTTFFREQGVDHVTLGVEVANKDAAAIWGRLGFTEYRRELLTDLGALERRLVDEKQPSFGAVHTQTDDQAAIERAVALFVPRLFVSEGTLVSAPRNGWVAVYDAEAERDPELLRRLGSELSNITGGVVFALGAEEGAVVRLVAFERGKMMDEYLSVPDYYRPLPTGDAMALRANPTLLGRLTGADPEAIRAVARTAASPAELPPAPELLAALAKALGIEGASLGFDEARGQDGAVVVEHR